MVANAAAVAAEAFAWQERAASNWFSTENALRIYNMVRCDEDGRIGGGMGRWMIIMSVCFWQRVGK
jgi:hypothetical protein